MGLDGPSQHLLIATQLTAMQMCFISAGNWCTASRSSYLIMTWEWDEKGRQLFVPMVCTSVSPLNSKVFRVLYPALQKTAFYRHIAFIPPRHAAAYTGSTNVVSSSLGV